MIVSTTTIEGIEVRIAENNEYPRVLWQGNNGVISPLAATQVNNVNNNNLGIYVKSMGKYYFVPKYTVPIVVPQAQHILGAVLTSTQSVDRIRYDKETFANLNEVYSHGTYSNMRNVTTSVGDFVEIPITYVKTETIQSGTYAGKVCYWIADGYADGFHVHPAFIGNDGQPHKLRIAKFLSSKTNNLPGSIRLSDIDTTSYQDAYNACLSLNSNGNSGYNMYSIYDHSLLQRLLLVEYGAYNLWSDIRIEEKTEEELQMLIENEEYEEYEQYMEDDGFATKYHNIYDIFGHKPDNLRYTSRCWLYGFECDRQTYKILKNDGSNEIIDTSIPYKYGSHVMSFLFNSTNNYDMSDIFIGNDVLDNSSSHYCENKICLLDDYEAGISAYDDSGHFNVLSMYSVPTDNMCAYRIVQLAD